MRAPSAASVLAKALRILSVDAVEAAKSGHCGLPLGMADVLTVLAEKFLRFDAAGPYWPDRDRLVLSAGHGSALLYSFLHLAGYEDVSREELSRFRQLGSRTPGHPEHALTPGVEMTTGPLGQGLASAVGMAIAERHLNARFGDSLVGHRTYVIAGDGCLMEGISQEALTLAGHLRLKRLVVLFDDNQVSIDGPLDLTDRTDQLTRFLASGWNVTRVDGHDPADIEAALQDAMASDRPVFIACRTRIGFGAAGVEGRAAAHGGPYGPEAIDALRQALGWPHPPFEVPEPVRDAWRQVGARGRSEREAWEHRYLRSPRRAEFEAAMRGLLPARLETVVADLKREMTAAGRKEATRVSSGRTLDALTALIPELLGGSADLTGSNNTKAAHADTLTASHPAGRYIHFGVREHAMAAAMNGMALHGGVIPFGGTFLAFSDYSRAAIRLGALMGQRVIHVMTHDSIGVGEDGPTHQPVEQLAALRAMPDLHVMRPCDAVETAECWQLAVQRREGPTALALTRQGVPLCRTTHTDANLSARGGYVIAPASAPERIALLATGSEVAIALEARARLEADGVGVRVVSLPCLELFEEQSATYRREVLGHAPRIAIEAGVRFGWDRYLGEAGEFVGVSGFGASGPADQLYRFFGITPDAVTAAARRLLG